MLIWMVVIGRFDDSLDLYMLKFDSYNTQNTQTLNHSKEDSQPNILYSSLSSICRKRLRVCSDGGNILRTAGCLGYK